MNSIISSLVGSYQLLEKEHHSNNEDVCDDNYDEIFNDELGSESSDNEIDDEGERDEQKSSMGKAASSKIYVYSI